MQHGQICLTVHLGYVIHVPGIHDIVKSFDSIRIQHYFMAHQIGLEIRFCRNGEDGDVMGKHCIACPSDLSEGAPIYI